MQALRRIRRLFKLPAADRALFIRAAGWLGFITLLLRLIPLGTLRQQLDAWANRSRGLGQSPPTAARITWAVRTASRFIPQAVCLPQALVVQLFYTRYGYPASLKIGVARDETGEFQAHAWVVSEDKIVIGALEDLHRFVPLSFDTGDVA